MLGGSGLCQHARGEASVQRRSFASATRRHTGPDFYVAPHATKRTFCLCFFFFPARGGRSFYLGFENTSSCDSVSLKMSATGNQIDSNEAALYDRQIRLWGVKAQNQLKNSRTLVVGLNALGAELCKNIVLAGLNVSVLDSHVVSARDIGALERGFIYVGHVGWLCPPCENCSVAPSIVVVQR